MPIATWKKNYKREITNIKNDQDIIKVSNKVIYEYKDGAEIKRRVPVYRNITKEVNETAKLLKIETLQKKAEELKNILQGEMNNND